MNKSLCYYQQVVGFNSNGNIVGTYIYGTKPHVPDYMIKDDTTYRILSDEHASVKMVVDTSNVTFAPEITYDEFGNVLNDTNPGFQPFYFAGGMYDQQAKLIRFGARDYDPETGSWIQRDPIRFDGGMNLYGYVGGDPVNMIDVTGLAPGDLFLTVDDAARDAHHYIFDKHPNPKIERGTDIYLIPRYNETLEVCEIWYTYSPFTEGNVGNVLVPYGNDTVAIFHTHTKSGDKNMTFADVSGNIDPKADIPQSHLHSLIYYMGREDQNYIHKYTPSSTKVGAGVYNLIKE